MSAGRSRRRWAVVVATAAMMAWAAVSACGREGEAQDGGPRALARSPIDAPGGGTSVWVRRLGGAGAEQVTSLGAGGGGTTALNLIGAEAPSGIPPYAIGLVRLRDDGSIAWSRQYPGVHGLTWISLAVTGMGNTFLSFHTDCVVGQDCMDLGAGQATGNVLLKLDPAGRVVWQRAIAATSGLSTAWRWRSSATAGGWSGTGGTVR